METQAVPEYPHQLASQTKGLHKTPQSQHWNHMWAHFFRGSYSNFENFSKGGGGIRHQRRPKKPCREIFRGGGKKRGKIFQKCFASLRKHQIFASLGWEEGRFWGLLPVPTYGWNYSVSEQKCIRIVLCQGQKVSEQKGVRIVFVSEQKGARNVMWQNKRGSELFRVKSNFV